MERFLTSAQNYNDARWALSTFRVSNPIEATLSMFVLNQFLDPVLHRALSRMFCSQETVQFIFCGVRMPNRACEEAILAGDV